MPGAALRRVNDLLARGAAVGKVVPDEAAGFVTRRGLRLRDPADLLVPGAEAAADLLCHADLGRIRRCAHPRACSTPWTAPRTAPAAGATCTCGNRANAAAYYRRHRANTRAPS